LKTAEPLPKTLSKGSAELRRIVIYCEKGSGTQYNFQKPFFMEISQSVPGDFMQIISRIEYCSAKLWIFTKKCGEERAKNRLVLL